MELNTELIKKLNSNDISKNNEVTKKIIHELWDSTTNKKKNDAVELGGYKDTKPFSIARNKGTISVRMVVVLSKIFNINPYYIIGVDEDNNGFNEKDIKRLLIENGFKSYIIDNENNMVANMYNLSLDEFIELLSDKITEKVLRAISNKRI